MTEPRAIRLRIEWRSSSGPTAALAPAMTRRKALTPNCTSAMERPNSSTSGDVKSPKGMIVSPMVTA